MKIFVINPGSTSTKIALYNNLDLISEDEVSHDAKELGKFKNIYSQMDYRKEVLIEFLQSNGQDINEIDYFVGRGGLLRPCPGGTYEVTKQMLEDLKDITLWGREHASNLGAFLADAFAKETGKRAFIVDPIVVNELSEWAEFSGYKPIKSKAIYHALNLRARAKHFAEDNNTSIDKLSLIGIHMGGGITVALLHRGKFVDLTNALLGNGPFTPQRCGAMAMGDLIDLCYSGKFTRSELKKELTKNGGLISYLGTDNVPEIVDRINAGDKYAKTVLEAMIYNICKYAGSMAAAVEGHIDAIYLTGGLAKENKLVVPLLKKKLKWIAPVSVYPGSEEALALVSGVYRVMIGEEKLQDYSKI